MISHETAATIRITALVGIGACVIGLVWAGGNSRRDVFGFIFKLSALVFAVVYFLGAIVTAEPELHRVVPRFP